MKKLLSVDKVKALPPLGAYIRAYRKDQRYSLDAMAKIIGTTKSNLWEIEMGLANNPTISTISGIARATKTTVARIATLAAHPHKESP